MDQYRTTESRATAKGQLLRDVYEVQAANGNAQLHKNYRLNGRPIDERLGVQLWARPWAA